MRMETTSDAKNDPIFEQSLGHADGPALLDTGGPRPTGKLPGEMPFQRSVRH